MDKLSCTIPPWLDPDEGSWEGREAERAAPEQALLRAQWWSTAVATCPQSPPAHTVRPYRQQHHEFTISRCNRRAGIVPFPAASQVQAQGRGGRGCLTVRPSLSARGHSAPVGLGGVADEARRAAQSSCWMMPSLCRPGRVAERTRHSVQAVRRSLFIRNAAAAAAPLSWAIYGLP